MFCIRPSFTIKSFTIMAQLAGALFCTRNLLCFCWNCNITLKICFSNLSNACARTHAHARARAHTHTHTHSIHFFLFNKTNKMHEFPKFILSQNSTCFRHYLCPSSGVFYCTFDTGMFLEDLMTASKQGQDGTDFILLLVPS